MLVIYNHCMAQIYFCQVVIYNHKTCFIIPYFLVQLVLTIQSLYQNAKTTVLCLFFLLAKLPIFIHRHKLLDFSDYLSPIRNHTLIITF